MTRGFRQAGEYSLKERLRFTRDTTLPSESNSGKTYPILQIGMRVERIYSDFWLWAIIVPLFLLTGAIPTSFVVPREEYASRAGITLTALLAIVAFQPTIEKLPDGPSTTLIDQYVRMCFIFAFILIMVQSVNAMHVGDEDDLEATFAYEIGGEPYRISKPFVVALLVWVCITCCWMLYVYAAVKWRRSRSKGFWKPHNINVLWLGPLNADLIGPRGGRTRSDKDEGKNRIEQIICSRLRELPAIRAQGHHVNRQPLEHRGRAGAATAG